ncbi:undecaprenyl-diphosphate phosphatase [bacterium]|nr:undecaprenyl-diphosphate phosphatase [bacterium]
MTLFSAIILSLIQGATEFLPVSSSGHLVLAEAMLEDGLPAEENLVFAILVHLGTLLAVLFVFRANLIRLIRYLFSESWTLTQTHSLRHAWLVDPRGRMILAVLLATFVTAAIGILGKDFFEGLFQKPERVGFALLVTAALLASTLLIRRKPQEADLAQNHEISFPFWIALAIGIIQGLAIIPGISRSGSTIAVAILLGLNRRAAGEFSFLIFIPAILGALVFEARDFDGQISGLAPSIGILAFLLAALSGYVFLRLLLRFVRGGQFGYFSIYCLIVGVWAIMKF